jgi:cytochrome c553
MKKTIIAALALLGAAGANAQGDAAAGEALYNNGDMARGVLACMTCHGPNGNSFNPVWPTLAGQHADYLAKQLADFKAGNRQDPTMAPMAAPLTEQDIANVTAYLATQAATIGAADAAKAARGAQLWKGGDSQQGITACMACHGPAGAGNPAAKFPALAGQKGAYAAKALKDFRSGARTNDMNQMMRDVASKLSDADIESLAEYAQGLHN